MTISSNTYSVRELFSYDRMTQAAVLGGFYRRNPHRFVNDYFGIRLKLFQKILIFMMFWSNYFCWIAARGMSKTYLSAIFCCARCVLYPLTKICIASGTRSQSINVLEKIQNELVPNSPALKREIECIRISSSDAYIKFKNGSIIKVVTASDSSRGNRANILIVDEFRMVDKGTVDTVLRRFLTAPRMPGYLHNPEYADLIERNKELMLSSAYFEDSWAYDKTKDYGERMLDHTKKYFVCGMPYQLSIKEGLLSRESVEDEMSEAGFNEIKWSMEMCAKFWGDSDGTFFDFNTVSKNRRIKYPMLPSKLSPKLSNDKRIAILPKQNGEKRILSADIALMSSTKNKNDASAIFINQLIPTKAGRYTNNIIYCDGSEGMHTSDQALMIRRLYEEFQCDYIVIDATGLGIGVYDCLVREMADPDSGEIYPALSCCNNQEMADRCSDRSAEKVIWAIKGNASLNSDCAVLLREGFKSGKIRLLMNEYDSEKALSEIKGYTSLSESEKLSLQMPYINTTLLINELVNLQHEESNGKIKVFERSGMRKDRYSSLSYNYYVATMLESKLKRRNNSSSSGQEVFCFKAPKIKSNDGRW